MKLANHFFSKQFLLFLATNGFAAGVNFVSRIVINLWTTYFTAIVIAYIFGFITAFTLNKFFVFNSDYKTGRQLQGFVLVNIFAILQTVIISMFLNDYAFVKLDMTFYPKEVAHLAGISFPIFTSFIGHKYFSFGDK